MVPVCTLTIRVGDNTAHRRALCVRVRSYVRMGRFVDLAARIDANVQPEEPIKVEEALVVLAVLYEQPDQRKDWYASVVGD